MATHEPTLGARDTCIHQLVEAQAARGPRAIAVALDERHLTYEQLNRRANQVAHRLLACGIGPEVPVGICMERSLEMVVGLLGILKAGGVYVPLDSAYPQDRLAYMLEDSRAPVLLTHERLRDHLPVHEAHTIYLDAAWTELAGERAEDPGTPVEPHHLAYIIYTSGSTGRPKGVCVEHEAAVGHFTTMQAQWGLGAADRVLAFASFSFDASLEQIFPTLYSGATIVLRGATGWAAHEFSRTARALRLTVADLPTAYWDQWVHSALSDGDREPFADLRLVAIGGDAARAETVRRWGQTPMRSIRLVNGYGPTETTITASIHELTPELDDGAALERVPIGYPLPNRTMYILDERGVVVPNGAMGELHIGGSGLARGYLNRPDLTAQRFIPDPFDPRPAARLYKTGDLAQVRADGAIEFLGRVDRQIKIRGFRIELGEIEASLSRHPAVQDTVVMAREDSPGDKRLVAYIVPRATVTPQQLRAFLRQTLPDYMMPGTVVFMVALPISPNGKVDRAALPAPDMTRPDLVAEYAAPRTPVEAALAGIWARVLHVERVDIHDAFLDLGGDSLLAMHVLARAAETGLQFTPDQLYRCQTIAELAANAEVGRMGVTAEQGSVSGPVPLTPALSRFLSAQRRSSGGAIEMLSYAARSTLDPALLEQAVRHVIAHHDALRLRFTRDQAGWQAAIAAAEENRILHVTDLSGYGEDEQDEVLDVALVAMEAGIDLCRGPLLKVALVRRGAGRPDYLVVLIHHLVVDAYSEPIIMQDLEMVYLQLNRGQAPRLPAKTTSFKSWAEHLAAYAQTAELQRELHYWLSLPWSRAPRLPHELTDTGGGEGPTEHVRIALGVAETAALRYEVAPALGVRFGDVLLAALARAFGDWTESGSLLVRLIVHGREPLFDGVDVSRTVGWFTTAYPALLDVSGVAWPAEAVQTVAAQLQRHSAHGIGYGLLRNLGPQEAAEQIGRLPQPEVHLNYLGEVDQASADLSLFEPLKDPSEPAARPPIKTVREVRLKAHIQGGRLRLRIGYHSRAYRRESIERVAQGVVAALQSLLAEGRHGTAASNAATAGSTCGPTSSGHGGDAAA